MQTVPSSLPQNPLQRISCLIGEAVCASCIIRFAATGEYDKVILSVLIALLVALPLWVHRFGIVPADWLTVFVHLYVLGVLLGHNFDFYDRVPIWDKLLHTAGGVTFAIIGQYLLYYLNRRQLSPKALTIVFMLAVSIAASAIWEFFEFGDDLLLGHDTQRDTYITAIHSRLLIDAYGEVGSIDPIESVVVNGVALPGYIDVGLYDTMGDMLVETFGAVVTAVGYALWGERYPAVAFVKEPTPKAEWSEEQCPA